MARRPLANLFVTPAGVPGNNTDLKSQTNLGYDVGVDWTPNRTTKVIVTGFYELFNNEFVTQSPGAGLMNFTYNVPHSTHRGSKCRRLEATSRLAVYRRLHLRQSILYRVC